MMMLKLVQNINPVHPIVNSLEHTDKDKPDYTRPPPNPESEFIYNCFSSFSLSLFSLASYPQRLHLLRLISLHVAAHFVP